MASFNSVTLMGNLTRDPELKTTQGGMQICTIGLAVSRKWFDKASNATKEDVLFVDCTAFGRTAEIAGEYLAKGKPVHLQGRLKLDLPGSLQCPHSVSMRTSGAAPPSRSLSDRRDHRDLTAPEGASRPAASALRCRTHRVQDATTCREVTRPRTFTTT